MCFRAALLIIPMIRRRLLALTGGGTGAVRAPAAASGSVAAPAAAAPSLRVLLAEDTVTNRLVAIRMLQRLGHVADAVGNGAEAIAALRGGGYDLVVIDVVMPEMDGLAATRQIRAGGGVEAEVPIVGLTARSGAADRQACLDAGMDAVTTKPVSGARLQAAIAAALAAATIRDLASPAMMTPRLRELAQELGPAAIGEIVAAFAEDAAAHLATLRAAAERGDGSLLHRAAHSIAGAAENVGAAALALRARALERNAGALSRSEIASEITRMQRDLDAVLGPTGIAGSR